MTIGLIVNLDKSDAVKCAVKIAELFCEIGEKVCTNIKLKSSIPNAVLYFDDDESVVRYCDIAVTVGGDGTIIHTAKHAARLHKPLIGVNLGRIGFVAGLERDEISQLKKLVTGEYKTQNRMLLSVKVEHSDKKADEFIAVNEAAISRDTLSSIIDISVSLNHERIITCRADGMIFATPTGSTAYSFSAGGPVLEPDMRCILLTPVCPHALSSRQVVFSDDSVLTANVSSLSNSQCYLTVDGQTSVRLSSNDVVTITKSPLEVELIVLKEKNFYTLLNEKLKETNYYEN